MKRTHPQFSEGILDAIGQTPLVRLDRFLASSDVTLYAKLEYANPGGSAKDRPARLMIEQALESGELRPGSTVIESSSGNMGIGLAQACRYYGLSFVCVVDPRAQSQNLQIIEALGGRIEMVNRPLRGDFLAARIARVCRLLEELPNSYWPNQYANPNNPQSHFDGTIREIDEALGDELDVLFVATSSTGTAQGCRNYLRKCGRDVQVVAVDSVGSILFGGVSGPRMIPGLGAGKEPSLAKGQSFDHIARVSDLDCVVGCRRLAQREAILVGGSAGGVLMTVDRMRHQLAGKTCAVVLHDSGTRYLSTVFDDAWVHESLGCDSERLMRLVHQSPVAELMECIA